MISLHTFSLGMFIVALIAFIVIVIFTDGTHFNRKKMSKKEKAKLIKEWSYNMQHVGIITETPTVTLMSESEKLVYLKNWKLPKDEIVDFVDNYNMEWLLKDETGKEWCEYHDNISLSDFEVIYGNNVHEIVYIGMRMKNG